jgi:hypothetical protein
MTYFFIINFEFLFLRIIIPVTYPILQICTFNLSKGQYITYSYCRPHAISSNFDILTFLYFINLSRHSPLDVFIGFFNTCMVQTFLFNLFNFKVIISANSTKFIKYTTLKMWISLRQYESNWSLFFIGHNCSW